MRVAERTRRVGVPVKGEDNAANPSETHHDTPDGAHRPPAGAAAGHTRSSSRAYEAQFPMTRRTSRDPNSLDVSPLIRTIQYLDEVLKRGVVIGIFEGSMEVSDEDILKALTAVRAEMRKTTDVMELSMRAIARVSGVHEAPGALQ